MSPETQSEPPDPFAPWVVDVATMRILLNSAGWGRPVPRLFTTDGQLICEFDIGKTGDGSDSDHYVSKTALNSLRGES